MTTHSKQPRVVKCATWDDFLHAVREPFFLSNKDGSSSLAMANVFRGHSSAEFKLSSTIERNVSNGMPDVKDVDGNAVPNAHLKNLNGIDWFDEECSRVLERFRQFSQGLPEIAADLTDLDLWAEGRHYGLLSPYLDWSQSPFVAAFFALGEQYKRFESCRTHYPSDLGPGTVHVWRLSVLKDLDDDPNLEIIKKVGGRSTRMRAQQAWFTRLRSSKHVDLEAYLTEIGKADYLTRYDIDLCDAVCALNDLERMNVNYLTLFPDVQGSAMQANISSEWLNSIPTMQALIRPAL